LEKFVKLPLAFAPRFIRYRYLFSSTTKAENPASHRCDVVKVMTIGRAFVTKAGYSLFHEIQKLVEFV